MKKNSASLFSTVSTTALKQLMTMVDETLDFQTSPVKNRTFTAAELWNIQRQKKSVRGRRTI